MSNHSPLTEQDMANLAEIRRVLDLAYDHYFEVSDGHCKSAEGHIALEFNTYFDRHDSSDGLRLEAVVIYSYVFGPERSNVFDTTAEALAEVKLWYDYEMVQTYDDGWV